MKRDKLESYLGKYVKIILLTGRQLKALYIRRAKKSLKMTLIC